MRLQKAMSQLGLCSRRKAEELIKLGKVKVNGVLISEMGYLVSLNDKIEISGEIKKEQNLDKVTFLFNKPLGVVSSVKDDRGRKVVIDFFKNENYRLYPVGRLDYNTSGALLVSNDGELTNLVTHPSTHLNKTYIATINGLEENLHKVKPSNEETAEEKEAKKTTTKKSTKKAAKRDPDIVEIEQKFIEVFGTKVVLKGSIEKGSIQIDYFSKADLDRLYNVIVKN